MSTNQGKLRVSGFDATDEQREAEKERVTKISGFRVAAHDFMAEVDLPALKARNDR
jgi:hypothetical protein